MTTVAVDAGAPDEPRFTAAATFAGLEHEHVRRLGEGEVVVLDGVLGHEHAQTLAAWLMGFEEELSPAGFGRGTGQRVDESLRGDRTRWLERGRPELEPYWCLVDRLSTDLCEKAWLGIQGVEVQLALYPGEGARYTTHHDAFAGGGRRRVTAVYYLNPTWTPGDGGELRVVTPSGEALLEPLLDRLVLFLCEAVEHEVQPVHAPRWALTAWFLGPDRVF